MNAVGIDVSKGKSTVTIRRPGDKVLLNPRDFRHTQSDISSLIGIIKSLDGETKVCMEHTGRYYPQDFSLLNEARVKLEGMIDWFYKTYGFDKKPRTYRRVARQDYLELAKCKKRTESKIRATVRKMLGYVKRDLGYLEGYMSEGYAMTDRKMINTYLVILTLYEQQQYMWDNRVHSVEHRIVSLSQPWIRPIVRGKVKAPTEFGAKFEVILDEHGYARITQFSFEAFNESEKFQEALIQYHERTGRWPKRVLVDQIYRTRANIAFCKERGIRISGPKLGRPKKDDKQNQSDKKTAYKDNTDRIGVERFSVSASVAMEWG